MACCPQTRRWRTGRIRLPCPITACTAPSRPRRKSCCRRYSGAYRQAVPGKKPTHTGRDATKEATGIKHEISIHAPHTGRDGLDGRVGMYVEEFQSTRPIRGATSSGSAMRRGRSINFNPRAPYGARQAQCTPDSARCRHFNPRAPYGARRHPLPAVP